ncbi:alpha/beta hydrolase [Algoriphagus sp.]|uniref:alpha/beta hydrolase n=1 Tax=Algoriphagus sp. TaxID=1872435 RepID=UPI00263A0227|nr:alpha/beta hydrolase [Algoriphagus sp.]
MKILQIICFLIFFSSSLAYSQKLSEPTDLSQGEINSTYQIIKDLPYGQDTAQVMDVYLSQKAKSFGNRNYTIVFLHGGAYYLSDKTAEERYIEPYLKKGLNVINLNYRLKRGIPLATSDLTHALNFLKANKSEYDLDLQTIILTGFSAGAQIATNVGLGQNNPSFPDQLNDGIGIQGIINFSGPVDDLDIIEKIFLNFDQEIARKAGEALFPSEGYAKKEEVAVYEPITYFDQEDPPIFLWHGGLDDQVPPNTFERFVQKLRNSKDFQLYLPEGKHSPSQEELEAAYLQIFEFLDDLKNEQLQ